MLDFIGAILAAILLATISLVLVRVYIDWHNQEDFPYPPGPPGHFIIGNAFDIPKEKRHKTFARWAKQYKNDVVSFRVPGFHTVVLNSLTTARDLFERKGDIYSDRPHLEMVTLMGHEFGVPLMHHNDVWRTSRSTILHLFRPSAVSAYRPLLRLRVAAMLKAIVSHPGSVVDEVRQYSGSLPMKIAYGRDVDVKTDHYVHIAEETVAMGASIFFPGAIIVNLFPFVKHFPRWLPGIHGFKTFAERSNQLCGELINHLFEGVKKDVANGTDSPSLSADFIRRTSSEQSVFDSRAKNSPGRLHETEFKNVMATIHLAAADTTITSLTVAILSLLLHPNVQSRAQAEIDIVVGRDRLPDFGDRASPGDRAQGHGHSHRADPKSCAPSIEHESEPNHDGKNGSPKLVYVEAIYREFLRWIVVLPLGIPHAVMKDDVYNGMIIRKGTIVVGNAWAILHDPGRYPDPEEFKPERFITEDGKLNDDDVLASFGFGRRFCPGRHLASQTLWLAVVSLLSVFDIVKAKDESGNEIDVSVELEESTICHPKSFACGARMRDDKAALLIRSLGRDNEA